MSGLDLQALHDGLAAQIKQYIVEDAHVTGRGDVADENPLIEVVPGEGVYVDYTSTFGSAGMADVYLTVKITVNAAPEDAQLIMRRYLCMGTGHGSGVLEGLNADKTLGGLCQTFGSADEGGVKAVDWTPTANGVEVSIPLRLTVKKVGATV